MSSSFSILVRDERPILVDAILCVAKHSYPDLVVVTDPVRQKADVAVVGGSLLHPGALGDELATLLSTGTRVVAVLDQHSDTTIERLSTSGFLVCVALSEGLADLMLALERAVRASASNSAAATLLLNRTLRSAPRISAREEQILELYVGSAGLGVNDIAHSLGISSQTVRSHLTRIRRRFSVEGYSVRSRLELAAALPPRTAAA